MKEKLFSVTKDDFTWSYFKSPGPGGQKKNKTMNCVRCFHEPSGAVGQGTENREQGRNKQEAFLRCVNSKKFQTWLRMEMAKKLGFPSIEETVEKMMSPENLRIESKDEEGRWKVETGLVISED